MMGYSEWSGRNGLIRLIVCAHSPCSQALVSRTTLLPHTVFIYFSFLSLLTPPTPSLSTFISTLHGPSSAKVGAAPLNIFLFYFDHLSRSHKQLCSPPFFFLSLLSDPSLPLMNKVSFYSCPSAKMPMIKDPHIN